MLVVYLRLSRQTAFWGGGQPGGEGLNTWKEKQSDRNSSPGWNQTWKEPHMDPSQRKKKATFQSLNKEPRGEGSTFPEEGCWWSSRPRLPGPAVEPAPPGWYPPMFYRPS